MEPTSEIFNADCLEKMKDLPDKSVDLIFCDLPYGQTSCKWDCCIDLEAFWKQVMRIKKLNTPIFFTTTTKFGVSLIQSAPKKCFFRYDLVWVKSACAGFLSAKKMPMRKHEMVYVFYEKLPFYDLSSHKHKFIKDKEPVANEEKIVDKNNPIIKKQLEDENYSKSYNQHCLMGKDFKDFRGGVKIYDPPLPISVVKEPDCYDFTNRLDNGKLKNFDKELYIGRNGGTAYDPPLPVSVVKTNYQSEGLYGKETKIRYKNEEGKITSDTNGNRYEPPLPNSMLEIKSTRGKHSTEKPVELMSWVLKYYSKEGDTILDPTCGSGSTGVACKNMNRNFIGIEMDEEIFKVAEERLK